MKIKKFLNNIMQEELSPIRARRAEYEKDIPAVYEILRKAARQQERLQHRQWQRSSAP